MRILFLTDNFPPEVNAPATRTYEHCREWVKLGEKVTVITCFPNFPQGKIYPGYKNQWEKTEYVDGIKIVRVWSYITPNEGFIKRTVDYISYAVTAFLNGILEQFDIIIATSPQFFTALAGRALSFIRRKPWIMEVRDLWPESIKTVGVLKDNILIRYLEKEELWCYKSAARIVSVTESFKKAISSKGIPEQKIEVIRNGANLELFQPQPKDKELLEKLKLTNKKVLGYIGTHGMAHKLDFILDCAKVLQNSGPEYHFLFIGSGAERKNLVKKVKLEGIKNVTMLESVPKHEVPAYFSILDAAIINLKKSSLFITVIPSKIFETAAMQVPMLIGVDGEARSIVEFYNAGLFYEPENQSDFLKKLQIMFSVHGKIDEFKKGCNRLAFDFDRKRMAYNMLKIIKETLGKERI